MAASSLYRFRLELSDVDRNLYEGLDFRLAMHPSEAFPFLLCRALAYALCYEPDLEFSTGGLSDVEEPPLFQKDPSFGGLKLWIEIGSPSARRLHKAAKAARRVVVFNYKNPELLLEEIRANHVHHGESIEVYSMEDGFLSELEAILERDNKWSVLRSEGTITVGSGDDAVSGDVRRHYL